MRSRVKLTEAAATKKRAEWHSTFCWLPTRIQIGDSQCWVWWEYVRRRVPSHVDARRSWYLLWYPRYGYAEYQLEVARVKDAS